VSRPGEKVSDLLSGLPARVGEQATLRAILDGFGERAFGALLVAFAAPLVLPMPPGVSAVLGLPLVLFTAQLALGVRRPWLPAKLANRSIRRRDLEGVIARVAPMVVQMERLLHPRLTWLAGPIFARLVGALALVLAVVVFLPIPFGNMFPSLAIALLGLGLVERDGLALLGGAAAAVLSLALLAWLSQALVAAGVTFVSVLLGGG
jgi:hypothetical protein